ncbi:hypothetical protein ACIOWG_17955 [Streptomyces sp. NPDC087658]|uniref:hypothetical protein n=1 Tax=Streptomyces sp. NPDC087658 TaxID=3365800 RepID=UPI00380F0B96
MSVRSVRTVRRGRPRPAVALLVTIGLLVTGCAGLADGGSATTADKPGSASGGPAAMNDKDARGTAKGTAGDTAKDATGTTTATATATGAAGPGPLEARSVEPKEIPGLGPRTRARISPEATQAVVASGTDRDSSDATVTVYERDPVIGWEPVTEAWPAHNALRGWTDDHVQGDLRSPIGVFTLTDAGGLLPDPGAELPYDRDPAFSVEGEGFEGESLEGSFDYVVAINYNRRPGTSPLDWTRPLGAEKGGGIWIHVDHGGPTQACVSVPRARMAELLRLLDPEKEPVVVMGDAVSLTH